MKCFKFELDSIKDNHVILADALCQIQEVHITTKSKLNQLREVTYFIQKLASMPMKNLKLKKLSICPSISHLNARTFSEALLKLETVSLVGSTITPLQENSLYESIIQTKNLILKSIDVRRTSTFMDNVNGNLKAEAIVKLVEFKGTVNEDQAIKILEKLYVTTNQNTKKLLLIVRKNFELPGDLQYCEKKMLNITSKLLKLKIINDL